MLEKDGEKLWKSLNYSGRNIFECTPAFGCPRLLVAAIFHRSRRQRVIQRVFLFFMTELNWHFMFDCRKQPTYKVYVLSDWGMSLPKISTLWETEHFLVLVNTMKTLLLEL